MSPLLLLRARPSRPRPSGLPPHIGPRRVDVTERLVVATSPVGESPFDGDVITPSCAATVTTVLLACERPRPVLSLRLPPRVVAVYHLSAATSQLNPTTTTVVITPDVEDSTGGPSGQTDGYLVEVESTASAVAASSAKRMAKGAWASVRDTDRASGIGSASPYPRIRYGLALRFDPVSRPVLCAGLASADCPAGRCQAWIVRLSSVLAAMERGRGP